MPYARRPLTPETLLAVMKPGVVYTPYAVGHKVQAPAKDVRKVLESMTETGQVTVTRPHKGICFILAGTEHLRRGAKPQPVIDPTSVAQPRTYVVLTGEITGYDAEIARRQALCMMTRGR